MTINILMYHSISESRDATGIPARLFDAHLNEIESSGYAVVSLQRVVAALEGVAELPPRAIALTFDDGYTDFAYEAAPRLIERGYTATVFLPTGSMGRPSGWSTGRGSLSRPVMTWKAVANLVAEGFVFGSHSVSHPDLTRLDAPAVEEELRRSQLDIEEHTGQRPAFFAPPYGYSNRVVREVIQTYYRASVSTDLGRVSGSSDVFNLPRIEMHHFRDPVRWRRYLEGSAEGYLRVRRYLRATRQLPGRLRRRLA